MLSLIVLFVLDLCFGKTNNDELLLLANCLMLVYLCLPIDSTLPFVLS